MGEKDYISDRRDNEAKDTEPEAVAQPISYPRCDDGRHCCDGKDGDRADLGCRGGISEFLDDCGDEEGSGVAGVHNTEVHEGAQVYLWVAEDAFRCALVETVHYGVTRVGGETGD